MIKTFQELEKELNSIDKNLVDAVSPSGYTDSLQVHLLYEDDKQPTIFTTTLSNMPALS